MTYLVMECHPSYAVVLDNEGRVIRTANMSYQENQVVGKMITRQTPKAPIPFRLAPLAAAAYLYLAVLGGGVYGAYEMPYGIVEVRISPGVKMSMSYMDRVAGLGGVNEGGKKLIDQVSYKGRNSRYMTGILVKRAIEMGYLTEGGTIYVAASGGSGRRKARRANAIYTGLDTFLEGGMPVGVHVESIGKDNPSTVAPHHKGEMPRGTGGDRPTFIRIPPGGMGEDADGDGEDDRDGGERRGDTENNNEENDADPDKYDGGDGGDREEDAGKNKTGDRDGGRDDNDKGDTDDRDDDIKKARDKSGRNDVVRQSSDAGDNKNLDDLDERDDGKTRNGLNDNRGRNGDDGGEHSDQDDSDEGDSDENDIDENDSQEEGNDGHEDGENDEDEDEDDND